jgi:hypothetical protein
MRTLQEDCPVCDSVLSGTRFTGFSCRRCKVHFSARFVAHLRRQRFKGIIDKHFGEAPHVEQHEEEEEIFLVPSDQVQLALEEAHEAVHATVQHLEDILGVSEQLPEAIAEAEESIKQPELTEYVQLPLNQRSALSKTVRKTAPKRAGAKRGTKSRPRKARR